MTVRATGCTSSRGQNEPAKVLSESLMEYAKTTQVTEPDKDLTVCDIIGEWGLYQWSLILFAVVYSGMFCTIVVVGPIWTPDIAHICVDSNEHLSADDIAQLKEENFGSGNNRNNNSQRQCFVYFEDDERNCDRFVYDDEKLGRLLTNSFDLVCDRQWLRSFIMSSALLGMLISSVTLGQLSDKYGRLRCTQIGVAISLLATLGAIVAPDYLTLNICVCLISYAQAGVGNALCTLVMEATTPRLRCVATWEYCFGWGLGMMVTPFLNNLTRDYVAYFQVLFVFQLALLPWLYFGVFESIRWLLSEGRVNEAQIEIRRACRINRVSSNPNLATKIARLQMQQVREASLLVADKLDSKLEMCNDRQRNTCTNVDALGEAMRKSFGYMIEAETTTTPTGSQVAIVVDHEPIARGDNRLNANDLDNLSLKTVVDEPLAEQQQQPSKRRKSSATSTLSELSPTLAKKLYSATDMQQVNHLPSSSNAPVPNGTIAIATATSNQTSGQNAATDLRSNSLTSQALVHLLMQYKNKIQDNEEGTFFLVQMFHKKLYKQTILLLMLELMLETSYYGFVQSNKFIGSSVELNYIIGAVSDISAATLAMILLAVFSRKFAIIAPTCLAIFACLSLAGMYQFVPEAALSLPSSADELDQFAPPMLIDPLPSSLLQSSDAEESEQVITMATMLEINGFRDGLDSAVIQDSIETSEVEVDSHGNEIENSDEATSKMSDVDDDDAISKSTLEHMSKFRNTINVILMTIGKNSVVTGLQVAATIALEVYPSNLRQTGSGAIIFVGRIGSIIAPFLFDDPSENKIMLKATLMTLAVLGILCSLATPLYLQDQKDKELCDRINEIETN